MSNKTRSPFYDNALFLMGITLCFWVITIIDQNTPQWNLTFEYGIKPKDTNGILGIFTAPLIDTYQRKKDRIDDLAGISL